ncbi:MAG TPA: PfkB family carbohydrate kinase [Vicinamibacteria bacterium]|nr:PfkB family carbohydrate kinase [Vicinamibacteria bacterium]
MLGGTAAYASLAAAKLGCASAVLTSAGPDFEPRRDLPGVPVFVDPSASTTRFANDYAEDGTRTQTLVSRAGEIALTPLPDAWRAPDVLLLGPVAGEVGPGFANALRGAVVGATAQGWLRRFESDGAVTFREWSAPGRDLEGVHALFFSEKDIPDAERAARRFLDHVPLVALTRGWRGLTLFTREGARDVPGLPRQEVDPTGAGDVLAAAFLVRYHETHDPLEAAAFGACAASCVVEAVGTTGLGDRAEVSRRLSLRERLMEEGEWDE